ncbi:hypothetical protein ONS95_003560 [Cadophora gregata]|uniref:uncharacterized protein n=1 Tax=Cadophora gregata TaxID=51156 RepID=UPI0026DC588D|nr:uncharacterized protein ONS95_003560 [Cadophora gregata]KAK0106837.1 hypothetical protein ONS95_003560 [Cadophora gregata]
MAFDFALVIVDSVSLGLAWKSLDIPPVPSVDPKYKAYWGMSLASAVLDFLLVGFGFIMLFIDWQDWLESREIQRSGGEVVGGDARDLEREAAAGGLGDAVPMEPIRRVEPGHLLDPINVGDIRIDIEGVPRLSDEELSGER